MQSLKGGILHACSHTLYSALCTAIQAVAINKGFLGIELSQLNIYNVSDQHSCVFIPCICLIMLLILKLPKVKGCFNGADILTSL